MNGARAHVLVCTGAGCVASGAHAVAAAFRKSVVEHDLGGEVDVVETGCLGPCAVGPVAVVYPDGVFYQQLTPDDAREVVGEHLLKGRVVDRLVHREGEGQAGIPAAGDIAFFRSQTKVALRNCGSIDPMKIEEYIARDGYAALARTLAEMTPQAVVEEITASGLRGRGGAGFPTGVKWRFAMSADGERKFVLCNADEGDPGAFMDRSILEGDPHSVIEAMAIAGRAIGSGQGYVYVRAEYPLAVERLGHAIAQAREYGMLGQDILGTGFDFDLEIRMGAGAFVCGEETALMTSIEGKRGEPRPRPPFPAQKGLWGMPSLLNNVETYASIPPIILRGADWYAGMGTEKSKGTKVFALAGKVKNTGLVEIPIGTPLGEIIFDIGGGIPDGKQYKAAQIGGPSGGCIPRQHLNVPVDYETLNELGAIMGSGGLIVMDEDSCMVDVARFFLEFVQEESCGKCTPCRVGTKRMLEILERICKGEGVEGDVERLVELGERIRDTALCGLGQTAPNPVLSTIRHFREEYDAHIRQRRCPAGVCPELVRAPCQNGCPAGVDVPGFVSLVGEKRYAEALRLHRERNPFASVCARVCFHPCERKCRRGSLDDAVAIRGVKRFMVEQEDRPNVPEVRADADNAKRKVAMIGAGPAGLSCAYFLARLGYRPEVLEAEDRPGGMLVQTIPPYRLPRKHLEREVRMIQKLGTKIITGRKLGRDFTLQELREGGYQAVFLAVGAPQSQKLGVPGEDLDGVTDALRFLRDHNLSGRSEVGRRVMVIGGGNAAVDAARTALRLGAESVTVAYRRTREEMPAYAEEVDAAEAEGVEFRFLLSPAEVVGNNGAVCAFRFRSQIPGAFDSSGRRRPVDSGEPEVELPADMVITAVGQSLPAGEYFDGLGVKLDRRGYVQVDPDSGRTSIDWLFSGGDAVSGPASVVEAVAAGERAAEGIDRYLTGESHAFWREERQVDTFFDPDADPAEFARARAEELSPEKRRRGFEEVEIAWGEAVAVREARRCLRCDYGKDG